MKQERDNAILEYIARKCKELRAERDVSQEIVYEDTGLHIGKIETAKKNVTISTLTKLCRYYGITIEEFFAGTNYPPKEK